MLDLHSRMTGHHDRWYVLGMSCLILCGQFFCYDTPASVHDHMLTWYGIPADEFSWFFNALYSAYSLPNLLLPLIFGWLTDQTSSGLTTNLLAVIAFIGQATVLIGVCLRSEWVPIFGRFMFGVGCESLGVSLSTLICQYFHTQEVAFALSLSVSFARFGTVVNDLLSPWLSTHFGSLVPFVVGSILASISVGATLFLVRRVEESGGYVSRPQSLVMSVKHLNSKFWLLGCVCATGYAAILPFTSIFVALRPANVSLIDASRSVSTVFLISALMSPILGRVIDSQKLGKTVLTASCFMLCITHTTYASFHHMWTMVLLGVAYAGFVASVWPLIPEVVPAENVGLAYGIATALQNATLSVAPLLMAAIQSSSGSYLHTIWLFLGAALLALFGSLTLSYVAGKRKTDSASDDEETSKLNLNQE